jgi:hypothetical protein
MIGRVDFHSVRGRRFLFFRGDGSVYIRREIDEQQLQPGVLVAAVSQGNAIALSNVRLVRNTDISTLFPGNFRIAGYRARTILEAWF